MTDEEFKKVVGYRAISPQVKSKIRFMFEVLQKNPELQKFEVRAAVLEHFGTAVDDLFLTRIRYVLGLSDHWPKRKIQ